VAQLSSVEPGAGLRSTLAIAERPVVLAQATVTDAIEQAQPVEGVAPAASQPADVDTTAATPPAQAVDAPAVAPAATPAVEGAEPEKREPADAEPKKPLPPPRNRAGEPVKTSGQVAVFVSKREKKVFVRQGFVPLFEMPITIEHPDQPLGTHVFTAMGLTADGTGMRWNLITVPTDGRAAEHKSTRSRSGDSRRKTKEPPPPVVDAKAPSSATEALNRIQMPKEAVERISEILIPGSSLVVSDQGLGRETGRLTEFIVETR
jgi:hypothetical protein